MSGLKQAPRWCAIDRVGDKIDILQTHHGEDDTVLTVSEKGKDSGVYLTPEIARDLRNHLNVLLGEDSPSRLPPAHSSAEQLQKVIDWVKAEIAVAEMRQALTVGSMTHADTQLDVWRRVLIALETVR